MVKVDVWLVPTPAGHRPEIRVFHNVEAVEAQFFIEQAPSELAESWHFDIRPIES